MTIRAFVWRLLSSAVSIGLMVGWRRWRTRKRPPLPDYVSEAWIREHGYDKRGY